MQTTQQSKRSPAHPFTLRSGQWHNGTNRPAAASSELHLLSGGRYRSSASAELIHAQRSRPNSWLFPPVEAAARTERQTWMPKSTNDSGSRSVHRLHLCVNQPATAHQAQPPGQEPEPPRTHHCFPWFCRGPETPCCGLAATASSFTPVPLHTIHSAWGTRPAAARKWISPLPILQRTRSSWTAKCRTLTCTTLR